MADAATAVDHLRRLLPEKVKVGKQIDTLRSDGEEEQRFSVHLFSAVDDRTGQSLPRTVRLIDVWQDAWWLAELRKRLRRLMSEPLAGVVRPLEVGFGTVGDRELIWIMSDRVDHRLSDRPYFLGNGLEENRCLALLEDVLRGLVRLHGVGLPHGALSPTSIGSYTQGDSGESLWIVDVETGPLGSWSNGELPQASACPYTPPEQVGSIPEPSTKGDLYALGLIGCQMLLGKGGDPDQLAGMADSGDSDLRPAVHGRLKQHGKGRGVFSTVVVDKLLNPDPRQRPTADEALQEIVRLRHQSWLARPEILGGLLAAMLLVLVGMGVMYWQDANGFAGYSDTVEATVGKLELPLSDCLREVRSLGETLAGDEDSIRTAVLSANGRIEDVAKHLDVPPGLKVIQARWMGSILDLSAARKGDFDGMIDAVDAQEDGRTFLKGWVKALHDCHTRGCVWFDFDDSLQRHYEKFAETPWDTEASDALGARLDALNRAAEDWKKWAADDELTVEKLKVEIGRASDAEREILNAWLKQLESFRPRLELESGRAGEGWGKTRQVRIWTDRSDTSTKVHDWKNSRRAVYKQKNLMFDWKLGDPVRIYVYGGRSAWWGGMRSELIEHSFGGPLALWRAARAGRISEEGNELKYRIEGVAGKPCPGPPTSKRVPIQ